MLCRIHRLFRYKKREQRLVQVALARLDSYGSSTFPAIFPSDDDPELTAHQLVRVVYEHGKRHAFLEDKAYARLGSRRFRQIVSILLSIVISPEAKLAYRHEPTCPAAKTAFYE